ncbi:hypothetical protein F66182_1484 [Fusarium sp. NRRL 66182]|nr:hypothetical protein F66182_1484 [Fusarium sp. NRRL 66182]
MSTRQETLTCSGAMVLPKESKRRINQASGFIFVDASNINSNGLLSKDAKISIRRQAARSGKKSHRLQSAAQTDVPMPEDGSHSGLIVLQEPHYTLFPHLSLKGYELLRATYNFDILDLATFAEVDLATNAHVLLQNEPSRYKEFLARSQSSFLAHLPSLYGQNACLDDAMCCVAARASQMVGLSIKQRIPDLLYGKAIESLQKEITGVSGCPTANSYCATRLLALYELLGEPRTTRLVTHLRGSAALLGLRQAALYESSFDRALLKSQGPSIVVNELYTMKHSMFEDPEWQQLFQHASTLETDLESCTWWRFFGVVTLLPGILKDLRVLFDRGANQAGYVHQSGRILERATMVHKGLHENNVLYQSKPPHPPSLFHLPVSAESSDRTRLREFFLYTMIFICRARATLSPDRMDRAINEAEAQTFATQALLIAKVTKEFDGAMAWHFEQRNGLAKSVTQTRVDWLVSLADDGHSIELNQPLAQRWLKWENSWRSSVLDVEYGV